MSGERPAPWLTISGDEVIAAMRALDGEPYELTEHRVAIDWESFLPHVTELGIAHLPAGDGPIDRQEVMVQVIGGFAMGLGVAARVFAAKMAASASGEEGDEHAD